MDKDRERKTSEAQRRANEKYDAEHIKRLSLMMPISEFDIMEEHIKSVGENRNRFIRKAISEKITHDNKQ